MTAKHRNPARRDRLVTGLWLAAALAASALSLPQAANAAFGVAALDVNVEAGTGASDPRQAAGHSDLRARIEFNTLPKEDDLAFAHSDGHVRNIEFDLPAGFSGNPNAVPRCDASVFEFAASGSGGACPVGSQVGVISVLSELDHTGDRTEPSFFSPVYAIEPVEGETARLAAGVSTIPVIISIVPRPDDLGLRARISGVLGGGLNPWLAVLDLWGVPADSSHDLERYGPFGDPLTVDPNTGEALPTSSQAPRSPFLTNPTGCGPVGAVDLRAASHEDPTTWVSKTADTVTEPFTGCDRVPFNPSVTVRPTDPRPDSPSGLEVAVKVPQQTDPDAPAASHVRKVELTLPPGVVISPAGASGLDSCSDAQLQLGADADAACPDASRIGSVELQTPILPAALNGAVYLRTPEPGHLFKLAIVAKGYGVNLKIVGEVSPDPVTGQLKAVFDNAPQQPFSALNLRFDGGPRAPLAMPENCGPATTTGQITGWNGAVVPVTDTFTVAGDCAPRGFAPALRAGTSVSQAGGAGPLVLEVSRRDGEQGLSRLDVQLPSGLTARVKDVPRCATAAAAAGTCGEESRIGSSQAAAGSGAQPLFLPGRVYLSEGYGGAPFGMSIVVPAKVGPFDLGTVVVTAKVFVDRKTAALRVVSEPLPTILQGIPLRLKEIRINVDRPGFTLNPTDCAPKQIVATIGSLDGATGTPAAPFQASGCAGLPFAPVLTATTNGRRWKGSGASLNITVKQPAGQANLRTVTAKLPAGLSARGTTLDKACPADVYERGGCSTEARSGKATAITPILAEPLVGDVWFVLRPPGQRGLPQLRTTLRGGGLEIDLVGNVVVKDRALVSTFEGIPDVPVSQFDLTLPQGPNSLLEWGRDEALCKATGLALKTDAFGHSGRRSRGSSPLTVTGCKAGGAKAKAKAGAKAKAKRAATTETTRG